MRSGCRCSVDPHRKQWSCATWSQDLMGHEQVRARNHMLHAGFTLCYRSVNGCRSDLMLCSALLTLKSPIPFCFAVLLSWNTNLPSFQGKPPGEELWSGSETGPGPPAGVGVPESEAELLLDLTCFMWEQEHDVGKVSFRETTEKEGWTVINKCQNVDQWFFLRWRQVEPL